MYNIVKLLDSGYDKNEFDDIKKELSKIQNFVVKNSYRKRETSYKNILFLKKFEAEVYTPVFYERKIFKEETFSITEKMPNLDPVKDFIKIVDIEKKEFFVKLLIEIEKKYQERKQKFSKKNIQEDYDRSEDFGMQILNEERQFSDSNIFYLVVKKQFSVYSRKKVLFILTALIENFSLQLGKFKTYDLESFKEKDLKLISGRLKRRTKLVIPYLHQIKKETNSLSSDEIFYVFNLLEKYEAFYNKTKGPEKNFALVHLKKFSESKKLIEKIIINRRLGYETKSLRRPLIKDQYLTDGTFRLLNRRVYGAVDFFMLSPWGIKTDKRYKKYVFGKKFCKHPLFLYNENFTNEFIYSLCPKLVDRISNVVYFYAENDFIKDLLDLVFKKHPLSESIVELLYDFEVNRKKGDVYSVVYFIEFIKKHSVRGLKKFHLIRYVTADYKFSQVPTFLRNMKYSDKDVSCYARNETNRILNENKRYLRIHLPTIKSYKMNTFVNKTMISNLAKVLYEDVYSIYVYHNREEKLFKKALVNNKDRYFKLMEILIKKVTGLKLRNFASLFQEYEGVEYKDRYKLLHHFVFLILSKIKLSSFEHKILKNKFYNILNPLVETKSLEDLFVDMKKLLNKEYSLFEFLKQDYLK